MNSNKTLTPEQALRFAIVSANIENDAPVCLSGHCAEGLYHFVLRTLCLRYEFYVDASNGEVLGIATEPLTYDEAVDLFRGEEVLPSVA